MNSGFSTISWRSESILGKAQSSHSPAQGRQSLMHLTLPCTKSRGGKSCQGFMLWPFWAMPSPGDSLTPLPSSIETHTMSNEEVGCQSSIKTPASVLGQARAGANQSLTMRTASSGPSNCSPCDGHVIWPLRQDHHTLPSCPLFPPVDFLYLHPIERGVRISIRILFTRTMHTLLRITPPLLGILCHRVYFVCINISM